MRTFALLGAATAITAALAVPASAAPDPTGILCGMATTDALALGNHNGVLVGGPLALGDDTNPLVVYSGNIKCSFQHGFGNSAHSAPDTCHGTGPTSGVVATYPPTTCSFGVNPNFLQPGYICTQVNIVTPTGFTSLYWDDTTQDWSPSSAAQCTAVAYGWVDDGIVRDVKATTIDPVICPILTPFFPPHGDVGIFYDCPPYSTSATTYATYYFWPPSAAV